MFEYIIENNEVTITGIKDESLEKITIPKTIEGYPVTKLNNRCIRFCNSLTNINIPKSVNKIHFHTFSRCDSLICINGVKLKEDINTVNNEFILCNKRSYKIIYQIGYDYHCCGLGDHYLYFIDGKRYDINSMR